VWEHEKLFVGTTVLRADESFGFCYFPHAALFADFERQGQRALADFHDGGSVLTPLSDRDDLIHGSVIPWVNFSAMSHARRVPAVDSVPKVTFGKYQEERDSAMMPVSVEVHHAVADGLHVARFLEALQGLFADPAPWV
jgi:chloramphenicol O-acetyltransferase type A